MIELAQTINNCKSLYFLANKVVYTVEDKTQISTYINNISFNTYLSILNISEFHNELYYFNDSILYKILTDTIVEIFKVEDVNGVQMISDDEIFTWKKVSRKEYLYSLHQLNMLKWQITTSDTYEYIYTDYFIVFERFDETKFSINNLKNERLWHYTLPEGFTIRGSVEAIDDVLFFIAYKDNHYQLVTGLDIETGNVLYQNQYEVTNERKFISAHAYNSVDKLYYGLGDVYQIFNPKTGEIVLEKAVEECESKIIRPYTNSLYDNKLWFVSGKYEDVKFGCLDIATQKVVFIQDFSQENDEMFDAPIFHEGKLYLKGIHYNNLYVFE